VTRTGGFWRAFWTVGHEPGRQVVALGVALTLTAVSLDVLLVGRLTFFFDLCFVALCLRDAIADPRDSLVQAVVSGVATHGVALFAGYALCLGWLGWRLHREGNAGVATEIEHELGQKAG
jgi:hypothetical protein